MSSSEMLVARVIAFQCVLMSFHATQAAHVCIAVLSKQHGRLCNLKNRLALGCQYRHVRLAVICWCSGGVPRKRNGMQIAA